MFLLDAQGHGVRRCGVFGDDKLSLHSTGMFVPSNVEWQLLLTLGSQTSQGVSLRATVAVAASHEKNDMAAYSRPFFNWSGMLKFIPDKLQGPSGLSRYRAPQRFKVHLETMAVRQSVLT
jgi:hypothetical protein